MSIFDDFCHGKSVKTDLKNTRAFLRRFSNFFRRFWLSFWTLDAAKREQIGDTFQTWCSSGSPGRSGDDFWSASGLSREPPEARLGLREGILCRSGVSLGAFWELWKPLGPSWANVRVVWTLSGYFSTMLGGLLSVTTRKYEQTAAARRCN